MSEPASPSLDHFISQFKNELEQIAKSQSHQYSFDFHNSLPLPSQRIIWVSSEDVHSKPF